MGAWGLASSREHRRLTLLGALPSQVHPQIPIPWAYHLASALWLPQLGRQGPVLLFPRAPRPGCACESRGQGCL